MQRQDFINEIFTFFKCKDEDLKRAYDLAFTVKEQIDWDKLYKLVLNEAESRYLPAPKWFKDFFPRCIKQGDSSYITPDGLNLRLVLADGYLYDFETYHLSYTLDEIKQNFMKKYGNDFSKLLLFDNDLMIWEAI